MNEKESSTDFEISKKNEWWPREYTPGLSVDDWEKLLGDEEVFTEGSLEIMKRMMDCGGQATCKKLSNKYGKSFNFYNRGSSTLAERVFKKTSCAVLEGESNSKFWPILYVGKPAKKEEEGAYIWKLREELAEALTRIDLSLISLYDNELIEESKKYQKDNFLKDVYMTEEKYDSLVSALKKKKNVILQGAPGVGKTFTAKRLAYSIMGEIDEERVEFIQFHQNYSYEDFMMGYKPFEDGFQLKYGIFYQFCQKASEDPEKDYFFIIDEINRGNMSKIFGELLMLIEADYRNTEITLAYNDSKFSVPNRLHIIGMMNTADRSLAMIDYALRRRFSFVEMEPGFLSKGFQKYQEKINHPQFDKLIQCIMELNQAILKDSSLGKGFCIGHSYFCGIKECSNESLKEIVEFDILPMLNEYWFDDENKLGFWKEKLEGVFR